MKMTPIKWVFLAAMTSILLSCSTSADYGVQVSNQASTQYATIPVSQCRISSYPPKGKYVVIATLTTDAQVGETPTHLLNRVQQKGAELGANYVMVTSVADQKFIAPGDVDAEDNTYLSPLAQFNDTVSPAAVGYSSVNGVGSGQPMHEVITAQALRITSGSNKPNKSLPSNVWQMHQSK